MKQIFKKINCFFLTFKCPLGLQSMYFYAAFQARQMTTFHIPTLRDAEEGPHLDPEPNQPHLSPSPHLMEGMYGWRK